MHQALCTLMNLNSFQQHAAGVVIVTFWWSIPYFKKKWFRWWCTILWAIRFQSSERSVPRALFCYNRKQCGVSFLHTSHVNFRHEYNSMYKTVKRFDIYTHAARTMICTSGLPDVTGLKWRDYVYEEKFTLELVIQRLSVLRRASHVITGATWPGFDITWLTEGRMVPRLCTALMYSIRRALLLGVLLEQK